MKKRWIQMIKYNIKNRTIEIKYDTGLELSIIMNVLKIFDLINQVKK